MEKIGIFGGSFNPPHLGHISSGTYAMKALGLGKLIYMPCSQTPGKAAPTEYLPTETRLKLCRQAAAGLPNTEVWDWELRQAGENYTCDTVRMLREKFPEAELWLLVGTDAFLTADRWKGMTEMAPGLCLGVLRRNDGEKNAASQAAKLEAMGAKVRLLQNPVTDISSTQLRRLLAFGAGQEFLPESVYETIRSEGLYNTRQNWKNLPMEALQEVVLPLHNPKRVPHVLGVRDTARELARVWGTDEEDAARAGLLHDITKALDGPLQLTLCNAYGKILSDFSRKYPKTLHALTGSLVAQRVFGENEKVAAAICCHTTGKADMTVLEKIIYVADYMEPNRDFPGVERLRELAYTDITAALQLGLEMTLEHLARQGSEVSPESGEALAYLRSQTGKE